MAKMKYILSSVPKCEPSVGFDVESIEQKRECEILIDFIRRNLGNEPEGCVLSVKPGRYGGFLYYTVSCEYEDTLEAAERYALSCEKDIPDRWDEEAIELLKKADIYLGE